MGLPLIIYHSNCADGFCAAWVARRYFGEQAEYVPANYGDVPPDVAMRDVYLLDFSYKRDALRRLISFNRRVVVLDHHKTAEAELAGLDNGDGKFAAVFDMGRSGGRLTWEYFFPGKDSPWLVDYTEDRDLWRWRLPASKEISAAIASYPFDFGLWDRWSGVADPSALLDGLALEGNAILRYQNQQVESQCRNAVEIEMDGHKILSVNATMLISEIAGKLAEGRPFGATWFVSGDGKKRWSLRSRDGGVDVSEVAKRHGGGGHRNAAGFEDVSRQ